MLTPNNIDTGNNDDLPSRGDRDDRDSASESSEGDQDDGDSALESEAGTQESEDVQSNNPRSA